MNISVPIGNQRLWHEENMIAFVGSSSLSVAVTSRQYLVTNWVSCLEQNLESNLGQDSNQNQVQDQEQNLAEDCCQSNQYSNCNHNKISHQLKYNNTIQRKLGCNLGCMILQIDESNTVQEHHNDHCCPQNSKRYTRQYMPPPNLE